MFIIYLDMALRSKDNLNKKINSGKLLAYADDIIIEHESLDAVRTTIRDLKSLETDWGLAMNLSKSEVLVHASLLKKLEKQNVRKIELIPVVSKFKYLGVTLSHNKHKVL